MSPDLELQKAIFARLTSDVALAALVDTRIHDNAPGDVTHPYLVLGESETRDWPAGIEHRLAFHCFTRGGGRSQAKTIVGAVHAALHDAALALEGHSLVNLRFLDAATRREADGITWRGTIRFRAITEETVRRSRARAARRSPLTRSPAESSSTFAQIVSPWLQSISAPPAPSGTSSGD